MKLKKILLSTVLISSLLVGCGTNTNTNKEINNNTNTEKSSDESKDNLNKDNEKKETPKVSVASVAISQVLAEMNQEIVGRPTTKLKLPEQYVNVPEIGSSFSPDFEKVLAVGTQLLIGDETFKDKIQDSAEKFGIDTFYVNTSTYEKFISSIEQLGEKLGKQDEAKNIIERFKKPLENIKEINKDIKVAIIFGTSESNMLATENTYVGSLVKAYGVKNIADEIAKETNSLSSESNGYINLNLEQLLKNEPDIILQFGHGNLEEANKNFEKLFTENPAWKNLKAVKDNKMYNLDSSLFGTSANIHMDEALQKIGEILNEQK